MAVLAEKIVRGSIQKFQDLEVYKEGFRLATDVFQLTRQFPKEELYALTTQMRNASRSIPANIAEGWGKRRYEMVFKRHLLDAMGSTNEMLVWLDMAFACTYITETTYQALSESYQVLARRLHQLLAHWKTFR